MTAVLASEVESSSSLTVPPRWATRRTPERPTFGPIVAAVSAAMGRPFMPHQQLMVDVGLEVQSEAAGDPDPGEWAYDDVTGLMQRRAGKTSVITPLAAHRARRISGARVFMTAQNRDKAVRRWREAAEDIDRSPLSRDVKLKISNMFEELRWHATGSLFVPFAPNAEAMHSETPDLVFVDELWAFSALDRKVIQAGYVPGFATTGGQAWKFSTAGTDASEWLNDDRRAGRAAVEAGVNRGKAYFEWSLPDRVGGVLVDDLPPEALIEACIAHHPAVCHTPGCPGPGGRRPCPHGFTVRPAAIRSAWAAMDDRSEFTRAYGNRNAEDTSDRWKALDEAVFTRQIDTVGIPGDVRVAFGVQVDDDSEEASVSAGWRDPAGVMHVELLKRELGTQWLPAYLAGKAERNDPLTIAVPNVKAARDVADALDAAGFPVLKVSQADLLAADARHRAQLDGRLWVHLSSTEAAAAAASVQWRDRWIKNDQPVTAFTSGALAGWGFDHAPEDEVLGPFRIM